MNTPSEESLPSLPIYQGLSTGLQAQSFIGFPEVVMHLFLVTTLIFCQESPN